MPKVIDFVSQFPEYLKIISHCTRKSEVSVWPYLFSIVGTSKLLFEVCGIFNLESFEMRYKFYFYLKKCLSMKDLETAASYLVVLQNTENSKTCEKVSES